LIRQLIPPKDSDSRFKEELLRLIPVWNGQKIIKGLKQFNSQGFLIQIMLKFIMASVQ